MVKPIKLEHVNRHVRNPASDFSQGFVSGWLSYRRFAAPAVLVGAFVFGLLAGVALAALSNFIRGVTW